jgi:PBSX family phage terminase large subunit
VQLFGRERYALGADKINQVSKLQGAGLSYCYGDEVTTWHENVFTMLKSRLDKPGACFDGTCNPDNPGHWFRKFLESDADIYSMGFTIDDNPFLDPLFVENLKREYAGTVFYQRFIDGLWVAAEGIIYRTFADDPERFIVNTPPPVMFCNIGVDFGGSQSAHAFTCTGFEPGLRGIVTLDEEYTKDELSPADLEKLFVKFVQRQLAKGYKVLEIFADSAEQVLIRGLRNALAKAKIGIPIRNAKKGLIIDRIRLYTMLQGCERHTVMRHCKHMIEAFSTALWNPKELDDARLDDGTTNIDSLDAQEYSTEKYQRKLIDLMMLGGQNHATG